MIVYSSNNGKDSGVVSFKMGENCILLNYRRKEGNIRSVLYSYEVSGKNHVEKIKKYAKASENLNTYLSKHRIRCRRIS